MAKVLKPLLTLLLLLAVITGGYWGATRTVRGQALAKRAENYVRYSLFSPNRSCLFGKPAQCHADEVCAFIHPDYSECVKSFVGSTPFVRFPLDPEHPVTCTNGPQTVSDDHGYEKGLYAIDLVSADGPGAPVYAATDGTAVVFRGCKDGDAACGEGYGNHIRLLNPHEGTVVLYAHLGQIWVEDGQPVQLGEKLGQVGKSGNTTKEMLHFSVNSIDMKSWLEVLNFYRNHPGAVPPSIPFETQYCDPKVKPECVRRRTRVEELPCSNGKSTSALLRADWRN